MIASINLSIKPGRCHWPVGEGRDVVVGLMEKNAAGSGATTTMDRTEEF